MRVSCLTGIGTDRRLRSEIMSVYCEAVCSIDDCPYRSYVCTREPGHGGPHQSIQIMEGGPPIGTVNGQWRDDGTWDAVARPTCPVLSALDTHNADQRLAEMSERVDRMVGVFQRCSRGAATIDVLECVGALGRGYKSEYEDVYDHATRMARCETALFSAVETIAVAIWKLASHPRTDRAE